MLSSCGGINAAVRKRWLWSKSICAWACSVQKKKVSRARLETILIWFFWWTAIVAYTNHQALHTKWQNMLFVITFQNNKYTPPLIWPVGRVTLFGCNCSCGCRKNESSYCLKVDLVWAQEITRNLVKFRDWLCGHAQKKPTLTLSLQFPSYMLCWTIHPSIFWLHPLWGFRALIMTLTFYLCSWKMAMWGHLSPGKLKQTKHVLTLIDNIIW